jgi:O-antigen ligase
LRFYSITNENMAVGFFANGNHNAAFYYSLIPFVASQVFELNQVRNDRPVRYWFSASLLAGLVVAVAIVGSRAGIGLALASGLGCVAIAYRHLKASKRALTTAFGGFLVALVVSTPFVISGLGMRAVEDRSLGEDLRWPVAEVTSRAALDSLPLGTGIGTFVPVYQMSVPRQHVFERYVNHAHDDWLELWLEAGSLALTLALGFLVWFGTACRRAWLAGNPFGLDAGFARAASITIILLMLHSLVDYPLRSIAIMTVFALSCGFLTAPPATERRWQSG